MSLSKFALPTGTLQRSARPLQRNLRLVPNVHNQLRRYVTEKEEQKPENLGGKGHGKSFQGQLWESTTARIQRQKDERAKYGQDTGASSGARNTAILFSNINGWICDRLHADIRCSNNHDGDRRILGGVFDTESAIHSLDRTDQCDHSSAT